MNKPELLLPAGSPEVLRLAVRYGADAVYLGGERMGLRAKAHNFAGQERRDSIRFAKEAGVRIYVTVNAFAHNEDLSGLADYLLELRDEGADALIVSDPGVFRLARKTVPELPLHISTQANSTNWETMCFWHDLGAKRIVAARELTLSELREIRERVPSDLELEVFVHGAMCMSYSGRCLLSNVLTGQDANRGSCTHPCRWKYALMEETRPGEYFPIEEDSRGTYILNSKDLCMIDHLPDLLSAGVDSLKIEGRMKNGLYIAVAARAYRRAIDLAVSTPEAYEREKEELRREVERCTTRQFSTGFFYGRPGSEAQIPDESTYHRNYTYMGFAQAVTPDGAVRMTQKNRFFVGERWELLKPDGTNVPAVVTHIVNEEGIEQESAPHAKQPLLVRLAFPEGGEAECFDVMRREREVSDRDDRRDQSNLRPEDQTS